MSAPSFFANMMKLAAVTCVLVCSGFASVAIASVAIGVHSPAAPAPLGCMKCCEEPGPDGACCCLVPGCPVVPLPPSCPPPPPTSASATAAQAIPPSSEPALVPAAGAPTPWPYAYNWSKFPTGGSLPLQDHAAAPPATHPCNTCDILRCACSRSSLDLTRELCSMGTSIVLSQHGSAPTTQTGNLLLRLRRWVGSFLARPCQSTLHADTCVMPRAPMLA